MAPLSSNHPLVGQSEQAIVTATLRGLGVVTGIVIAILGVMLFSNAVNAKAATGEEKFAGSMAAMAVIVGGIAVGVVLWALATIVRNSFRSTMLLRRTEHGIDHLAEQINSSSHHQPAGVVHQPATTETERLGEQAMQDQEMIDLLRDISENTLLAESERSAKRQRVAEEDRRHRVEAIEDLVRGGEWPAARRAVAELIKCYPDAPEARQSHNRVEQAAAKAEEQDLKNTTSRVEELMSISSWDQAVSLAEEMTGKHPTSVKARQLFDRVQREHRLFSQEQVRRLMKDIERAVERHRYREALSLATNFVETYPKTREATNLRTQLPQLRGNAEVEERKQLEEEIKELVRRRSFSKALDLAGKVIDIYPTSPQAKILREQIPRIREAAAQADSEKKEIKNRIHQ